jgi:hypothetical protein
VHEVVPGEMLHGFLNRPRSRPDSLREVIEVGRFL